MSFSGKNAQEKFQDIVREVRFMSSLRHEHVVMFRALYLKDNFAWLIMEYCLGSASDILEVHKSSLSEDAMSEICCGTLKGLSYLHKIPRIHRDIKAGNILLTSTGAVKIADFGSASLDSPANSFVGTPYWMAPEVILAMDEGQYDCRVDIWSLGITCIELAERKPPLFHMHAMSALYHIPQKPPPFLSNADNWSTEFQNFITVCLQKEPESRPYSQELLQHPFIIRDRPNGIVLQLVEKTQESVRLLDKQNYKRLQKLVLQNDSSLENKNGDVSSSETRACSYISVPTSTNLDMMDDDALSDVISLSDDNKIVGDLPHDGVKRSGTSALDQCSSQEPHSPKSLSSHSIMKSRSNEFEKGHPNKKTQQEIDEFIMKKKKEMSIGNRERFSTLRPASLISKEESDLRELREQMAVLKRMKQQHQRQFSTLALKNEQEKMEMNQQQRRDLDIQTSCFNKEMEKIKAKNRIEIEHFNRAQQVNEKKYVKQLKEVKETKMKHFVGMQKGEYKTLTTNYKKKLDSDLGLTTLTRKKLIREEKDRVLHRQSQEEHEYLDNQEEDGEKKTIVLRENMVQERHALEKRQLEEELNCSQKYKDLIQEVKRRQSSDEMDMSSKQMLCTHNLRLKLQDEQHTTEWLNQQDYNGRRERELRKKHLMEQKQQPRSLRLKENQIKRQFTEVARLQMRQYKMLEKQLLQDVPKHERGEVLKQAKEERNRKLLQLEAQYQKSIEEMLNQQTLRMDEAQSHEQEEMRRNFQQDQELLSSYQKKKQEELRRQHDAEKRALKDQNDAQIARLREDAFDSSSKLQEKRLERQRNLQTKHLQEMEEFRLQYIEKTIRGIDHNTDNKQIHRGSTAV
ncbi:Serine/threonine-protein kinase TAO1-like isoform X1 [Oopsacas minuta]|uniref:non-specific serine/threonine protein kinase n=1 Tax=Oopsacas minuta TaxID=111878 RepID=A0AAV7JXG5_9METZ|nr:Serine/threonine-protein kinase TAO1-like isoform X1 [Oopsacas minuta]